MTAAWPWPRVLAHRGGGALAPENTLAALRCGWEHDYRAVEFDVMLAADGVPVLMHDPEFGRTVAGTGAVAHTRSTDLVRMDAGAWFGPAHAGEMVPLYVDAVRFCRAHGLWMNVEIKPAPGHERQTGTTVATLTRQWFADATDPLHRPLLSSFSEEALKAARDAAPELPRGLLFDQVPPDWRARLQALDCVALHCNERHLDAALAQAIKSAGYGLFCYTINDAPRAHELATWGMDAFCTDRIDRIAPDLLAAIFSDADPKSGN